MLILFKVFQELGVIFDSMDHHHMWFITSVSNFSSLAWLEVCQVPPVHEAHTWRMLMVPDRILGGQGHP